MSLNEIRTHHDMVVLHDEIAALLTDYENPGDASETITEEDLYDMLVYAQNYLAQLIN